ncbi:hypothetical protein Q5M85_21180 [Paraclostridium bifermentans]|nr:hypothetical protein [Paraclostridium bifermentans]
MLRKFSNLKESREMINQFISELPKFEGLDDLVVDDYNKMIRNRAVMDKDI